MVQITDNRRGMKGKVTPLPMLCLFCREALPAIAVSSMAVRTKEKEEPSVEEEVTVDTAVKDISEAKPKIKAAGNKANEPIKG